MKRPEQTDPKSSDEPLSLDMSFDEALELLLNTPPPNDQQEEEQHQEERKQDECE